MERIENKILTREQMRHLQKLGLDTSDAALSWIRFVRKSGKKKKSKWKVRTTTAERLNCRNYPDLGHYQGVTTYTLQEVLDKLPKGIVKDGKTYFFYIEYPNDDAYEVGYRCNLDFINTVFAKGMFVAAYKMLCWLLENALLATRKWIPEG